MTNEFLWNVSTLAKPYSPEVAIGARKKFCTQLSGQEDQLKDEYVQKCMENIKANR